MYIGNAVILNDDTANILDEACLRSMKQLNAGG